jgi:toxin secretion/phage lysis holin
MSEWVSTTLKAIGAAVALWWGDLPALIKLLLLLQWADVAAGAIKAWSRHKLNSRALRQGLARKVVVLLIVLVCHALESAWLHGIGAAVAGWYVVYELLSLLEHAAQMGVPIPAFLTARLERLKEGEPE